MTSSRTSVPTAVDPAIAGVLARIPPLPLAALTASMFRGVLRASALARPPETRPALASIEDIRLDAASRPIRARVYRAAPGPVPTLVYFHGGGWVAGDLETHDPLVRQIALTTGATIVSVDYRQPPEAPFPAAFEDAVAATQTVWRDRTAFGGTDRVAVGGDSAGGNLAAAVALACRDAGPPLVAQFLLYPITDVAGHYRLPAINALYPSRTENAEGYLLTTSLMSWFADAYVGAGDAADWRVSPLRSVDLRNAAPALLATAVFDPLRDEGLAYGARLRDAGVAVVAHAGEGLIHGYFDMAHVSRMAQAEIARVSADLRQMLWGDP